MNERTYEREAWNSPFAAHIFRYIYTGEADYTSQIATKLNTQPQTVSNYLKGLRNKGFIQRSEKSGRKQRYEANLRMLVEEWFEHLESLLQQDLEQLSEIESHDYEVSKEEIIEKRQQALESLRTHDDEIKDFAEDFVAEVLENLYLRSETSLKDLFFQEFAFAILANYYKNLAGEIDIPKRKEAWLNALFTAVMRARTTGQEIDIMSELIEGKRS